MNKSTGKPKGTAFVEFGTAEAAGKAVAACQAHRDGKGAGVSLKGKQLSIDAALVQDSARALAQQQDGFTHDKDKRNLYLVRAFNPTTMSARLCCLERTEIPFT